MMGRFIALADYLKSLSINLIQDISAIYFEESAPDFAISLRSLSERLDAMLEIGDLGIRLL
jgi:hypothetical protein